MLHVHSDCVVGQLVTSWKFSDSMFACAGLQLAAICEVAMVIGCFAASALITISNLVNAGCVVQSAGCILVLALGEAPNLHFGRAPEV